MCDCGCSGNAPGTHATTFSVPGMTGVEGMWAIADAFAEKLPGTAVEIDLPARTVRVAAPCDTVGAILAGAGYPASAV